MAVKITRQTKNIVLLGSATSAAALRAGHERAPAALRAAGIGGWPIFQLRFVNAEYLV